MQPLRRELFRGNLAVDQCDGGAIGKAVIGGLARFGPPLLGVFADNLDGGAESGNFDFADPRDAVRLTIRRLPPLHKENILFDGFCRNIRLGSFGNRAISLYWRN